MSEIFENRFAIKRVSKSDDIDYIHALSIYNATTPLDIKTNTNELTTWLDKQNTEQTFEMLLFILYLDNDIIGLAMLSYIPKQRIVIYDYIALYENYRRNAVLFAYISLIQNYLILQNLDITYSVVEISNKNNGKEVDKESRIFKRLICLEGYGMVDAKYSTIPLGLDNFESSFDAHLYIKANDNVQNISKNTFMSIVHAIYYEYYLTWYSNILVADELKLYKQKVDECYKHIEKQVVSEISLHVKYVDCPLIGDVNNDKTYGYLPSRNKKNYHKYPLIILTLIVSPVILIWGYNYILTLLNIPLSSVSSTVGGIFGAISASITAFMVAKKKS